MHYCISHDSQEHASIRSNSNDPLEKAEETKWHFLDSTQANNFDWVSNVSDAEVIAHFGARNFSF